MRIGVGKEEGEWISLAFLLPERMKDMPVIVYVIRFDCL